MEQEKWVTWDGLKYYDTKIKAYVETKVSDLQETVASKDELTVVSNAVTKLIEDVAECATAISNHENEIVEHDDAIKHLHEFELSAAERLAALEAHQEHTVNKEDLNDYATRSFVTEEIIKAQLSGSVDLSDYYRKGEVDNLITETKSEVTVNTTKINGVAAHLDDVEADVTRNHELIEQLLVDVENKANETHQHHVSDLIDYQPVDLTDYAKKSDIPDLAGYATEEFVAAAINAIEIPEVDLSNYYNKDETTALIEDALSNIDIPDVDLTGYATQDFVLERVAAVDNSEELSALEVTVEDLSQTVTNVTSDLNSVQDSVSDNATAISLINDNIDDIESDVTDLKEFKNSLNLSDYAKTSEVNTLVSAKANNVLFTDNYIVTNPVGEFGENDSVQNLTIAEILTKLLGLKTNSSPDRPSGSSEAVQDIIDNRRPIYSQESDGTLAATEFDHVIWTPEEADKPHDGENDFYQIVDDNGNLIESGYHESTTYNEEAWLTIALPESVTEVVPKVYDSIGGSWTTVGWKLVKTDDTSIDGYIVWTVPEEYEVQSGHTYRFVINN